MSDFAFYLLAAFVLAWQVYTIQKLVREMQADKRRWAAQKAKWAEQDARFTKKEKALGIKLFS